MDFKCILAMVKPELTDAVVTAAKEAGATGATVLPGKGTGIHEAKMFFGLTLDVPTDVIFFLLQESLVESVLEAVETAGKFSEPATGIAFVFPVDAVRGLQSQLEK